MRLEKEPKVSSPPLPPEVHRAEATRDQALVALVALAEALGTPSAVPAALEEAEAALKEAREAQEALERSLVATEGSVVALGTLGDEDEELLRVAVAELVAEELEQEQGWLQAWQRWLRAGQGVAVGLMVLFPPVLSLDSARAALGVTEDSHLLLALGTVAVSCQVALRALGTSRRHLAIAASHQRDVAWRLRDRARRVATARATSEATAATAGATAATLGRLGKVTDMLGTLVAAVSEDRKVTPWGTRGQGFPQSAWVLGDIAVALGTLGGEEVTRRLQVAQGRGRDGVVALSPHGDNGREALRELGDTPMSPTGSQCPPNVPT